jgi:hypothetical protein
MVERKKLDPVFVICIRALPFKTVNLHIDIRHGYFLVLELLLSDARLTLGR